MLKKLSRPLALAVALAAALALSSCGGGIPEDKIKQDVSSNEIVTSGIIQSKYVSDDPYELVEFSVTSQTDQGGPDGKEVAFEGKIANDNFETSFTGAAFYMRSNDEWHGGDFRVMSSTTTPLKGVSVIDEKVADNLVSFESTLDGGEGSWTSTATQVVKNVEWFANDTITSEQTFVFDAEQGWMPQSELKVSAVDTEWLLAGKSFSCTTIPLIYSDEGDVFYTITFGDIAEDGTVTANYKIDYDPAKAKSFSGDALNSVHVDSTATGKIVYEPGKGYFSVELNDPSNSVTFSCESASKTISAGSGTVNSLRVEIVSNIKYGSGEYDVLASNGSTFTEIL